MIQKVTLKFPSLQLLADCINQLGIQRPNIDYEQYILKAELTEKQLQDAKTCQAEILDQIILQ